MKSRQALIFPGFLSLLVLLLTLFQLLLPGRTSRAQTSSSMPTFTDVASSLGVRQISSMYGPNAVDYNRDQRLDLMFTNHFEPLSLFEQTGSGSFNDVSFAVGINDGSIQDNHDMHGAAWGDCDEDGRLDLYIANGDLEPDRLFRNQGNNTFVDIAPQEGVDDTGRGRGVSWIDYDDDGDLDIYLTHTQDKLDVLYRNDGGCTFTGVSAGDLTSRMHRFGATWADYDGDGDMDVFAQSGGPASDGSLDAYSQLYRNNGDGTFSDVTAASGLPLQASSENAAWGDYDNDGDQDLLATRGRTVTASAPRSDANRLYRNNGNGTFTNVSSAAGVTGQANSQHAAFVDLDNDGDLDIYIANAGFLATGNEPNFLYENQGDGTFREIAASVGANGVTGEGMSGGVAIGDVNRDGFSDIVISHGLSYYGQLPGPHEVLLNGGNGNHWLQLQLRGQQSNGLGIGARIEIVTPDGRFQMRQMNGGVHNYAQDEMIVSFGLGDQTSVSHLTIYWPSGTVQELSNIAADQRLTVTESEVSSPTPTPTHTSTPTSTSTPGVPEEVIVDNADPEFSVTGFWNTSTSAQNPFYGTDYRFAPSGDGSRQATFRPTVSATGDYEVFIWYFANSQLATNAPYTVNFDGGSQTFLVDHSSSGGGFWLSLGVFPFAAGTNGTVVITNNADGYVVADAIRLVPADGTSPTPTNTPQPIPTSTPSNTPLPATPTPTNTPQPGPTNTPTNTPTAGTPTPTNTPEPGPTDTPTNTPLPITPTPTNTAEPVAEIIVDNADPEFSVTGFWNTSTSTQNPFYGANYRFTAAGDGSRQATFRPAIPAGGDYEVFIWYFGNSRQATNQPYTVNFDGGSQTFLVDHSSSGGGFWLSLGVFNFVAGTDGTVVTTNNANGHVVADAIRLVPQ